MRGDKHGDQPTADGRATGRMRDRTADGTKARTIGEMEDRTVGRTNIRVIDRTEVSRR